LAGKIAPRFAKGWTEDQLLDLAEGFITSDGRKPDTYIRRATDGYLRNPVAHTGIKTMSAAVASIPVVVFRRGKDQDEPVSDGPLVELITWPNPEMPWPEFVTWVNGYWMLDGNAFIRIFRLGKPSVLWPLRPDLVTIKNAEGSGSVIAYEYNTGGRKETIPPEDIIHLRTFNPRGGQRGVSDISPALRVIDSHNAATEHNASLLERGARPSGSMIYRERMTDEQFRKTNKRLKTQLAGPRNAGRFLVLDGDAKFQELALKPKDLDWRMGKQQSGIEICSTTGVAPELQGFQATKTFSNYQEARKALYTEGAIPRLQHILAALNSSVVREFGREYYLGFDKDQIDALKEERAAVWERTLEALKQGAISINEFRELNGLSIRDEEEANQLFIPAGVAPLVDSTWEPNPLDG